MVSPSRRFPNFSVRSDFFRNGSGDELDGWPAFRTRASGLLTVTMAEPL
jgi:hypothetical protein